MNYSQQTKVNDEYIDNGTGEVEKVEEIQVDEHVEEEEKKEEENDDKEKEEQEQEYE